MSRGLRNRSPCARGDRPYIRESAGHRSSRTLPAILATGAATVYVLSNPGGFFSLHVPILRNCIKLIRPLPIMGRMAQNLIKAPISLEHAEHVASEPKPYPWLYAGL